MSFTLAHRGEDGMAALRRACPCPCGAHADARRRRNESPRRQVPQCPALLGGRGTPARTSAARRRRGVGGRGAGRALGKMLAQVVGLEDDAVVRTIVEFLRCVRKAFFGSVNKNPVVLRCFGVTFFVIFVPVLCYGWLGLCQEAKTACEGQSPYRSPRRLAISSNAV